MNQEDIQFEIVRRAYEGDKLIRDELIQLQRQFEELEAERDAWKAKYMALISKTSEPLE